MKSNAAKINGVKLQMYGRPKLELVEGRMIGATYDRHQI
jgi:hypothetical protein